MNIKSLLSRLARITTVFAPAPALLLLCSLAWGQQSGIAGNSGTIGTAGLGTVAHSAVVAPANFYVSTTGSDSNPGTFTQPFATINKAALAIRGVSCSLGPRLVYLRGGFYYNTSVNFTSADASTATCPTTYESYPAEIATLSGGKRLTGWSQVTTGTCALANANGLVCWQTTIPNTSAYFERLYYNGTALHRPNLTATAGQLQGTGYGVINCSPSNCYNGTLNNQFVYTASDGVTNWASCANKHCEVFLFNKWTAPIQIISTINTTTKTITTTCTTAGNCPNSTGSGAGNPFSAGTLYMIDNIRELLQFGGQWYLDTSTNPWTISYVAVAAENPNNDIVQYGVNSQLMTTSVTSGSFSLAFTTFSGLQFMQDNWQVPATGYISLQLDPNLTNSMVECTACNQVTFFGDVFAHTTTIGLQIDGASKQVTATGSAFLDTGAYGVRIGVRPDLAVCGGSCTDLTVPNNITVTQSSLNYVSRFFPSSDGIMFGLTNSDTVTFNDIGYAYDKGIEVCMPSSHTCGSGTATDHDIVIANNHIHNIGQGVMTDLAGVYASTELGVDNVLENNLIHDTNGSVLRTPVSDAGAYSIYLDDFTGRWTVTNNVTYRQTGTSIHLNGGPQVASAQDVFTNNIFLNSAYRPVGGCIGEQAIFGGSVKSFVYQNNICAQDLSTHRLVNPETAPANTTNMQFIQDVYSMGSGAQFNISGVGTGGTFSQWNSIGQDTTGSVTATLGFKAPGNCAGNSTVPVPLVCDDFRFTNGTGPGFGFVYSAQSYGPTVPISIPAIAPTFPEIVLPLNQY